MIETCALNGADPQAWLADHPAKRIADLVLWSWEAERLAAAAGA